MLIFFQLCMLSSISVAMTTDYTVLYIDTGGGFHIQRVRDILCAKCTDNQVRDKEIVNYQTLTLLKSARNKLWMVVVVHTLIL